MLTIFFKRTVLECLLVQRRRMPMTKSLLKNDHKSADPQICQRLMRKPETMLKVLGNDFTGAPSLMLLSANLY